MLQESELRLLMLRPRLDTITLLVIKLLRLIKGRERNSLKLKLLMMTTGSLIKIFSFSCSMSPTMINCLVMILELESLLLMTISQDIFTFRSLKQSLLLPQKSMLRLSSKEEMEVMEL